MKNRNRLGVFLLANGIWISLLLGTFLGGCDGKTPPKNDAASSSDDAPNGDASGNSEKNPNGIASSGVKQLFDGWPQPEFALVLTGRQQGYIEPCGCTEGQSGGISRRADLILRELTKKRGWPTTALELGDMVRRSRQQSKVKFEIMLAAMKDMGYRVMGLGPQELRFGAAYLLSKQDVPDENHAEAGLTFLGANIVFFDSPDLAPASSLTLNIAGKKIGVTAILGTGIKDKVFPGGTPSDIKILDPEESLPAVIRQMKKEQPDLLVLLSFASTKESTALAKKFPEFDLIVSASGPEDPGGKPIQIGNTMLVTVGAKGKHVGVVGFFPDDDKQRLRFELVELKKDRFDDNMKMVEHMRYYQDRLKQEQLSAVELPIQHPSGAEFVGVKKCAECHETAYKIWKKTPHANAFNSLKHARKGDPEYGITRIFDAECLACHVTGWNPQQVLRYKTGFINKEFATDPADKLRSKLLQGQQCESCHGPGSRHIDLIDDDPDAAKKLVRVTKQAAEDNLCIQCHDLDNSPDFDFEPYWEYVKHYGTD